MVKHHSVVGRYVTIEVDDYDILPYVGKLEVFLFHFVDKKPYIHNHQLQL